MTFVYVTLEGVMKFSSKRKMEEDTMEGSVETPTVYTNDWSNMLEGVEDYIRNFHGLNETLMSYVVRKQLVPTSEAGNPSNAYDNTDEEIIAKVPIVVAGTVGTAVDLEANRTFVAS